MALGYQALLYNQIGKHSVAAQRCEDKLVETANLTWTFPEDERWVTWVGFHGSRILFYGIATVLVVLGTWYCLCWGHPCGGWFIVAVVVYLAAAFILAVAWVSIVSKYSKLCPKLYSTLCPKFTKLLGAMGFASPRLSTPPTPTRNRPTLLMYLRRQPTNHR